MFPSLASHYFKAIIIFVDHKPLNRLACLNLVTFPRRKRCICFMKTLFRILRAWFWFLNCFEGLIGHFLLLLIQKLLALLEINLCSSARLGVLITVVSHPCRLLLGSLSMEPCLTLGLSLMDISALLYRCHGC